jgi:hypothetical protein
MGKRYSAVLHKALLVTALGLVAATLVMAPSGCSTSSSTTTRYKIIKPEDKPAAMGGIPPDKEAQIQLVLKQREPSARKCYQTVMDEKLDRSFEGTVLVLIDLTTSGQASDVKVVGGTLANKDVEACLIETIKEFTFPALTHAGQAQYEYSFRPAY